MTARDPLGAPHDTFAAAGRDALQLVWCGDAGAAERARAAPPARVDDALDRAGRDPALALELVSASAHLLPRLGLSLGDDLDRVRRRLARAIAEGEVRVLRGGVRRRHVGALAEEGETRVAAVPEVLEAIRVVVVLDRTWQPISGVTLVITPPSGGPVTRQTGADGAAELQDLRPGACGARAVHQGATLDASYEVVGVDAGEPPAAAAGAAPLDPARRFVLALRRHKVATGETLASVARADGTTWDALARYNFGSDEPRAVHRALRRQVGCRHTTHDGKNYRFDDGDQPGVLWLPHAWTAAALRTGGAYTVRVRVPRVTAVRPYVLSM